MGGGRGGTTETKSSITIWGTVPSKNFTSAINYLNTQNPLMVIKYVQKDPRNFESDLLNAYAFGGLPDMFFLSQDLIFSYEDKIVNIPFTYFPERTYDDTYTRSANIFKNSTGFLGFPILADPLVMYYNRDILENAGFVNPPKYWSDLFEYVPKLVVKNEASQITRSAVSLGEFSNIKNAKAIFSALVLQLENPIVSRVAEGRYTTLLNSPSNVSSRPTYQSLKFFNEFSDPLKNVYTWNKTMKDSENAFISGDLAIYFGFASELSNIKAKNPNLNFDVATLPQVKELNNAITYSNIYALAIPKTSPTAQTALTVAADLANGVNTWMLVAPSGMVPVRRDLLNKTEIDKYQKVFYSAGLSARSWIDPNNSKTTEIFSKMIEDVSSGLSNADESVKTADTALKLLLLK